MIQIFLTLLYFISALMLAVIVHELGHTISALICGVKVEAFSVGFGKPIWHKKLFGIDVRFCPILLGGYTKIAGEFDKRKDGFLAQRYSKKVFILLSGVAMNFLLACICYKINYGSIIEGFTIDMMIFKSIFTKDYLIPSMIIGNYMPNIFLLQLSLINIICALFNIVPFPALDGGMLWLVLLENKIKNFERFMKKIFAYGFAFLMILQFALLIYVFYF